MLISATLLPDYVHIFQEYLQHTYVCIDIQWDVREALHVIQLKPTDFGWTILTP